MSSTVTLLTESRYVNPTQIDDYIQNILTEDGLVADALRVQGLKVNRVDWADNTFNWNDTDAALFRTTWDYFHRYDEFMAWLEATSVKTRFFNSARQVKWNLNKKYLLELDKKGINIPTTLLIPAKSDIYLKTIMSDHRWDEVVIKPAVSGAGRHTYRVNHSNLHQHEAIFQELIGVETMLVQPFMQNVLKNGELALMFIDGKFTHAIKKIAKSGEFRVQDDFGGSVQDHTAKKEEIAFASRCISILDEKPVYARVDMILDNKNEWAVAELELIEPELWFRFCPSAADRMAEVIVERLG